MKSKNIITATGAGIIIAATVLLYLVRRRKNTTHALTSLKAIKTGEARIRQVMHIAKDSQV